MNKHDRRVIEYQLNEEKAVLNDLKRQYEKALADINNRIKILQADDTPSRAYQADYQKTLKAQVEAILEKLHADEYDTIHKYLADSYTSGYVGTMYAMGKQGGIHVLTPIDRKAAVKAITTDSELKTDLYAALGYDLDKLKKTVREEITRGIATSLPYEQIARSISDRTSLPLSNANRIVRTEGHRIQQASADDARNAAKEKGADVVKQWDASLDGATRKVHRELDGQIRETDEPFTDSSGKWKAMYPGKFGKPEQDCNCRCVALTRARWALDENELDILKQRAEYFGLDKTKDFNDYKEKYLKATKTVENTGKSGIIDIEIDSFTPCLRDTKTGDIVQTAVSNITSRNALKQYSKKTGWNVDWAKMPDDVDVYALSVQDQENVQGLVGIKNDDGAKAVYLHWASTAPNNNKRINDGKQDYEGVGGHLFAIAAEKSIEKGYGGFMYGFAANEEIEKHYIDKFGAEHVGILHPYHFIIDEEAAKKLLGRYSYEWK